MKIEDYYGRLLTASQVPVDLLEQAQSLPSMVYKGKTLYCSRCGTMIEDDWRLADNDYYCRACIAFGRNQEKRLLYHFPAQPFVKGKNLMWKGKLTPFQKEVSQGLLKGIAAGQNMLVHAVTGAGKTEMIYDLVATVIDNGGQVALASPRVDVCIELHERMSRDFRCPIALLHANGENYQRSPLVIATTHQLLKFYQTFDLIIVDEVDAFPYVDNPMLYHAVDQAIKPEGRQVFLTATSTEDLDKKVTQGLLRKLHLARRFHANPLVLPTYIWQPKFLSDLKKGKLPSVFLMKIREQRQTNFPLLIFFPNIELGKLCTALLQKAFPNERIAFVASTSSERSEYVQSFRDGQLSILVTTTILERGVTFPGVDVFVAMANHRLYTKSSLIQIGGRVGRSIDRPTGLFYLFHDGLTKSMIRCQREIKEMNHKGGFV
ncbi:DEAD/DEAH box helicase [Streptococcus dentiloxodontae]